MVALLYDECIHLWLCFLKYFPPRRNHSVRRFSTHGGNNMVWTTYFFPLLDNVIQYIIGYKLFCLPVKHSFKVTYHALQTGFVSHIICCTVATIFGDCENIVYACTFYFNDIKSLPFLLLCLLPLIISIYDGFYYRFKFLRKRD